MSTDTFSSASRPKSSAPRRAIVHAHELHAGLTLVVGDARHHHALERQLVAHDPGAGGIGEARPHMHRNAVLHRHLHASDLQHFCAQRRELEHLFVADARDLAGGRAHVGIGRVDPVHVGVDLARAGADGGGHGDGAGVAASATEGGDVALLVDALKPRDDGDVPRFERAHHAARVDGADARLHERAVGEDLELMAEEAAGAPALRLDGDGSERRGDLLAGGGEGVGLARVGGRASARGRGGAACSSRPTWRSR
jgi:hypothetical protein